MNQALTVRCKLIIPINFQDQVDETLVGFADACNQILAVAKRDHCWNKTKLHHKVYKTTREATGLKANHVCQAIKRVINQKKASKQIHKFRPTSISLDARTFKYVEDKQQVGITLKSNRVNLKMKIGGYQIALLRGQTPTSATLSKNRQGDYYINCGWVGDADHNGALNIANLGGMVVNPSESSTMFCSLEQSVLGLKPTLTA